ncbi:MAG TPA: competence/damage-inducible protein A [Thermoleophilia bacterium]|nr:competence/damage-inducible protein A [Thermoleophilia bacterium]
MRGTAELIFTGDELLRGDIVNTNQAYLGERLLELGVFATHAVSVTDDREAISRAIVSSLLRHPDILILSGGLGPTEDDLTREAVSDALNRPLVLHEELLELIRERFRMLDIHMGESNRKQALIPTGAQAIPIVGTAPGFWIEDGETLIAALPGVPRELEQMWTGTLGPLVSHRLGQREPAGEPAVRRLRLHGIGESTLADVLSEIPWRGEGVEIGTRASLDGITLILRAQPDRNSRERLAEVEERVRDVLGAKIFGADDETLAGVLGSLLRDRGLTLATAESCTGGLVAKRLTDQAGSSDFFLGGVVTYGDALKTQLLGVDPDLLREHGAVSEEVALAMARGARERLGATCSIAVTGIAGPTGGTASKPVGLVYVATAIGDEVLARRFNMFRSRDEIRERTAYAALDVLRRRLLDSLDR